MTPWWAVPAGVILGALLTSLVAALNTGREQREERARRMEDALIAVVRVLYRGTVDVGTKQTPFSEHAEAPNFESYNKLKSNLDDKVLLPMSTAQVLFSVSMYKYMVLALGLLTEKGYRPIAEDIARWGSAEIQAVRRGWFYPRLHNRRMNHHLRQEVVKTIQSSKPKKDDDS